MVINDQLFVVLQIRIGRGSQEKNNTPCKMTQKWGKIDLKMDDPNF
jgi:hypothetical protein